MKRDINLEATLVEKFLSLSSLLDERARRLWAATESIAIGYGGDAVVSSATGLARETIRKGRREIEAGVKVAPKRFLHERDDFVDLVRIVSDEQGLLPTLVEKDYWIMHCLYGLNVQGYAFELKGGTSLSKGHGIIHRFSEDIDIHIDPHCAPFDVFTAANQTKKEKHIDSRRKFYDWLAENINISGIINITRDRSFDDEKYRSGGIRLHYHSHFERLSGLKEGILLEVGFDDTAPNNPLTISSWAYDRAIMVNIAITDNRAIAVPCYHPGYTFVEKLQTISTKFRQQQITKELPANFLRHYYDISQLLEHPDVASFIGTDEYHDRKKQRFRRGDPLNAAENEAFLLSDPNTREQYTSAYNTTESLYYNGQPAFESILAKIKNHIEML